MKNLLIGQSGGPTAVINSSLAGAVSCGLNSSHFEKVFGTVNGVEGILKENFISMDKFRDEKLLNLLKQTPSSYLGSCRKKLPTLDENEQIYEEIFSIFEKHNIGTFAYIGGNDSMDTVLKLSKYAKEKNIDIKIAGIPKTIDNDLVLTDHTPGYGSAAKFIANSVKQLSMDSRVYDLKSVLVVEIMGRNAGWLTAAAALSNTENERFADIIALPETPFLPDSLISETEKILKEKNTVIIALSEGIKDKNGMYMGESINSLRAGQDSFNHAILGGVGRTVESLISASLGVKTRTVELSTLQRSASFAASSCDVEEAFRAGFFGVTFATEGKTGFMAGFKRISDQPYSMEIVPFDIEKVANFEKKMPAEMINGFDVTEKFINYAKPLIFGEPDISYTNGIIDFVIR